MIPILHVSRYSVILCAATFRRRACTTARNLRHVTSVHGTTFCIPRINLILPSHLQLDLPTALQHRAVKSKTIHIGHLLSTPRMLFSSTS